MIRHIVVFKLKSAEGSPEMLHFFDEARKLATIPGVDNFECLKQLSDKNNFEYGLSMEFDSQQIYDYYTSHPDHVNFVDVYWMKEVEFFLEMDYALL